MAQRGADRDPSAGAAPRAVVYASDRQVDELCRVGYVGKRPASAAAARTLLSMFRALKVTQDDVDRVDVLPQERRAAEATRLLARLEDNYRVVATRTTISKRGACAGPRGYRRLRGQLENLGATTPPKASAPLARESDLKREAGLLPPRGLGAGRSLSSPRFRRRPVGSRHASTARRSRRLTRRSSSVRGHREPDRVDPPEGTSFSSGPGFSRIWTSWPSGRRDSSLQRQTRVGREAVLARKHSETVPQRLSLPAPSRSVTQRLPSSGARFSLARCAGAVFGGNGIAEPDGG